MKRWRWKVIGLVVLVAGAVGTVGVYYVRSKGPTPAQVERQIRADVPLGTPRAAVEDYLRVRGIQFAADTMEPSPKLATEAGLRDGEIKAVIYATVEPAFVNLVWDGQVRVYFLFDGAGRLIGYAFQPFALAL